jgi:hypothetical protein
MVFVVKPLLVWKGLLAFKNNDAEHHGYIKHRHEFRICGMVLDITMGKISSNRLDVVLVTLVLIR